MGTGCDVLPSLTKLQMVKHALVQQRHDLVMICDRDGPAVASCCCVLLLCVAVLRPHARRE
jgi:hypothetical protein